MILAGGLNIYGFWGIGKKWSLKKEEGKANIKVEVQKETKGTETITGAVKEESKGTATITGAIKEEIPMGTRFISPLLPEKGRWEKREDGPGHLIKNKSISSNSSSKSKEKDIK